MPISKEYLKTLRRRAIQDFIRDNSRSPTESELNVIIRKIRKSYSTVDQVGISGFDMDRARFKDTSSARMENVNRSAMYDDLVTMSDRLDSLLVKLEDSHRGFYATSRRVGRLLSQTESRLDNLLLLNGSNDAFITGVEETFDTQEAVDHSLTTAQVETNYVTLGRTGYTPLSLEKVKLTAACAGDVQLVGKSATGPISSLKRDDGDVWEYQVYTREQQGRVTLVMQLELPEPSYVGDVRINSLPLSANKQMTATCFYSLDGQSFVALEPVEQVVTEEMSFQLGIEGVRKIQFSFSKDAADSHTGNRNRYMYVFSFDSIKIFTNSFRPSKRSELFCGPYPMLDDVGAPVNFTKATMSACFVEPEGTSVSFYLSQDGVNWLGVSPEGDAGNYVSFQDGSASQAADFVDDTLSVNSVVEIDSELVDFQSEAVLNSFIHEDWVDKVPLQSIVVKRNLAGSEELLGSVQGWRFEEETQQHLTTLYVESASGRYIQLGDTSAYLNGNLVTGQVYLPQGYSTFATSDSNWLELDETIDNIHALNIVDSLYPYNHLYLAQGYPYPSNFAGEQIYQGADEYFASLMSYRSPEEFAVIEPDDPQYYNVFTVEDVDGAWYIKVKVNKTDSSWKQELFSVDWAVQSATTNNLYVKALLSTSEPGQTPRIESFRVRVI